MQACEVCGWDTGDDARVCATCRADAADTDDGGDAAALLTSVVERARGAQTSTAQDADVAPGDAPDTSAHLPEPRTARRPTTGPPSSGGREHIVLREVARGDARAASTRSTPSTIAASLLEAFERSEADDPPPADTREPGRVAEIAARFADLPTTPLRPDGTGETASPDADTVETTATASGPHDGPATGGGGDVVASTGTATDPDVHAPTGIETAHDGDADATPDTGTATTADVEAVATTDAATDGAPTDDGTRRVGASTVTATDTDDTAPQDVADHTTTDTDDTAPQDVADHTTTDTDDTAPQGDADDTTTDTDDTAPQGDADDTAAEPDGGATTTQDADAGTDVGPDADPDARDSRSSPSGPEHVDPPAQDEVATSGTTHDGDSDDRGVEVTPPSSTNGDGQRTTASGKDGTSDDDDEGDAWTAAAQVVLVIVGALCVFQIAVLLVVNWFLAQAGSGGTDVTTALAAYDKVASVMLPVLAAVAFAAAAFAAWRVVAIPSSARRVAGLPLALWGVAAAASAVLVIALLGTSVTVEQTRRMTMWAIAACVALGIASIAVPRTLSHLSDEPATNATS